MSAMRETRETPATEPVTAAWIMQALRRVAEAARADADLAAAAREAVFETGLFDIFGSGERFDPVDVLDTAGEDALRVQLTTLDLAPLRAIVRAHGYDPERETARWRSAPRFVELIVERAKTQLEQERKTGAATKSLAEAAWML